MTEAELCAAFEKIHPSHRDLQIVKPKGKTHWLYLKTKPEEELGEQTLVHFELGHGTAQQLAEFMVAAMTFARDRYAPGLGSSDGDLMVPSVPSPDEQIDVRLELRGIVVKGTFDLYTDNSLNREHFKQQLRDIGLQVETISATQQE
jgi:hypothetical protein